MGRPCIGADLQGLARADLQLHCDAGSALQVPGHLHCAEPASPCRVRGKPRAYLRHDGNVYLEIAACSACRRTSCLHMCQIFLAFWNIGEQVGSGNPNFRALLEGDTSG